jgi:hypothetical protein
VEGVNAGDTGPKHFQEQPHTGSIVRPKAAPRLPISEARDTVRPKHNPLFIPGGVNRIYVASPKYNGSACRIAGDFNPAIAKLIPVRLVTGGDYLPVKKTGEELTLRFAIMGARNAKN